MENKKWISVDIWCDSDNSKQLEDYLYLYNMIKHYENVNWFKAQIAVKEVK